MSVISAVNSGLFGGGSGGGTLSEVLANGNSAGDYSIEMNGNNIDNCSNLTTVGIIGSDTLTITNYEAGADLNIASGGNINLFFGDVGELTLDGEVGTIGQVLISSGAGVAPTWGSGGGGSVGTLSEVLANGNSAGALTIDMNGNDINSVYTLGVFIVAGQTGNDLNLVGSGGMDIVINSNVDIYLGTSNTGQLYINGDAGTAGQVLTSGGTGVAPTWGAGGGGSVGTLTEVLANGNSAGTLDIDMNNNDIDNVNILGVSSVEGPVDDDLNLLSSGGFNIVINSDVDIELNTGTNGILYINGDAGTAGQVLTSGGSLASPVWADGGGGSVGTLSEVLGNGDSASGLDIIDLNTIAVSNIISAIDNDDINITTTTDGVSIGDIIMTSGGNIWMGFGATSSLYLGSEDLYNAGTVGQVLTSQGEALPPIWSDTGSAGLPSVLSIDNSAGAFDIDINDNSLLNVAVISGVQDSPLQITSTYQMALSMATELYINGEPGLLGQVLGSQGLDAPPIWVPLPFVPNFLFIATTLVPSGEGSIFTVALGASDVIPIGTYFCHYYFQIASGVSAQFVNVNLSYNLNGVFNLGTIVQNSPDGNSVYMTGSYYFLQPVDGGAFGLDATITLLSDVGVTINPANDSSNYYALFQVSTTATVSGIEPPAVPILPVL